jgi:hypothetical protein
MNNIYKQYAQIFDSLSLSNAYFHVSYFLVEGIT